MHASTSSSTVADSADSDSISLPLTLSLYHPFPHFLHPALSSSLATAFSTAPLKLEWESKTNEFSEMKVKPTALITICYYCIISRFHSKSFYLILETPSMNIKSTENFISTHTKEKLWCTALQCYYGLYQRNHNHFRLQSLFRAAFVT